MSPKDEQPDEPEDDSDSGSGIGPSNRDLIRGLRRGELERTEAIDWAADRAADKVAGDASAIPLFQKHRKVFPRRVKGRFRNIKWGFLTALLAIYYLTPWIRWDRGPYAPDQAVLIDMPARRFYFFFIEIWPQEVYYLAGLLFMAAIGLFFATALFGRVWCAWGCPQTVWTDLFVWFERKVEGDRNARIKLDSAPWTVDKFRKRFVKHAVWLLISMITGGAWIFYFADAPTLAAELMTGAAPPTALGFIGLFTATTYILAGHAREQVCTYMCPYARFQSAMIDEESLIVTYRADRGEQRGPHKQGDSWEGRGHCVDCTLCVAVCPTGIDIRNGIQIECINCGLCTDACNSVMQRVGLPKGLIGLDSSANVSRRADGLKTQLNLVRPRMLIYGVLLMSVGLVMATSLATRGSVDVNVLKDRNPVFVLLSDGSIRNGYRLKVLNKVRDYRDYRIEVAGVPGAIMTFGDGVDESADLTVTAPPDAVGEYRLFVRAPGATLGGSQATVTFSVIDAVDGSRAAVESAFTGPAK